LILPEWFDYLTHPAFLRAEVKPSPANGTLRELRGHIAGLKKLAPPFVDKKGSSLIDKAIANLEAEEQHLLSERRNITYECELFGRSAPKELGNLELAERYGVSVLVLRRWKQPGNAYDVLKEELEKRGLFVRAKTIQMKVRRLDEKIRTGLHLPWSQILEDQYLSFKYSWFVRLESSAEQRRHWGQVMLPVLKPEGVAQWHGWQAFSRGLAANRHDLGVDGKTIRPPLMEQELSLLRSLIAVAKERSF